MTFGIDHERKFVPSVVQVPYNLPDGLQCQWIYANHHTASDNLKITGEEAISQAIHLNTQVRLTLDHGIYAIHILGNHLQSLNQPVKLSWARNKYFNLPLDSGRKSSDIFPHLDWKRYQDFFVVKPPVALTDYDKDLVYVFMMDSFGTDIQRKQRIKRIFDETMHNPTNHMYLLQQRGNPRKAVGTFLLKYLPEMREVQLHCVAGRGNDSRIAQWGGKLYPLMAAVLNTVETEYSSEQALTFSASRAAEKYEQLGFLPSSRAGLVINPL